MEKSGLFQIGDIAKLFHLSVGTLRHYEKLERKIDNRLRQIEDAVSSEFDVIRFVTYPARRIAWIRNPLSIGSYLDLEVPIRQLEDKQKNALVFLGKIGVGISQENLITQTFQKYDLVFMLLDPEDEFEGDVEKLPPETCVILRFCGSHTDAPAQYQKLVTFINNHNLQIAGFSKEITMIDYGITNDTEKFVTEIQIPIHPK